MRGRVSLALAALLAGCGAADPAPEPPPAAAGWTVSRHAPVIPAGSLRPQALWNDPSLLRTDEGYVLYMTSSTGEPFKPPVLPFRATSPDGRRWTLSPATPLLSPEGGPYASIETPSVARFRGRYWMAFTGIYPDPDPSPMAIGLAISPDGIDWRIAQWTLLRASGGATDWNGYLVGEPGLAVLGDRLFLYFSAVGGREGGGPPLQSIGLVTSTDGVRFSAPRQVLRQGPLYPAAQGYAGYSSPAALARDGGIDLFYSVAHVRKGADPEWQQAAIHHARSADGDAPFVEDKAPVLTRRSTDWTDGEILAPAPLVDGTDLQLWFAGHVANAKLAPLIRRGFSGPEFGIGIATLPLEQFDRTMKGTAR
ncbi:glycoside hydrolase family protein [Sphingobium cloacae]|uniref:Glycosyl hydrolase family 32 N-terminal domain-containing protein n=1 Tax=Sphingobium cloacae TaxID=120107 RepID=A0A1E1F362_9SPHN|nr:hypothetical protein [Sphingobium cloacae]BAV64969.1 hypothetical protein SCLO_1019290 [Sphingobium cloacae]